MKLYNYNQLVHLTYSSFSKSQKNLEEER